jgi:hypothetical protein
MHKTKWNPTECLRYWSTAVMEDSDWLIATTCFLRLTFARERKLKTLTLRLKKSYYLNETKNHPDWDKFKRTLIMKFKECPKSINCVKQNIYIAKHCQCTSKFGYTKRRMTADRIWKAGFFWEWFLSTRIAKGKYTRSFRLHWFASHVFQQRSVHQGNLFFKPAFIK